MNTVELYDYYYEHPEEIDIQLREDTFIDLDKVSSLMALQPGLYVKWSQLSAYAEMKAYIAKKDSKEIAWPIATQQAEEDLIREGKKVTVSTVENRALLNTGYIEGKKKRTKSEWLAGKLKRAEWSIIHTKDMLQSLNSRQKSELDFLPKEHN